VRSSQASSQCLPHHLSRQSHREHSTSEISLFNQGYVRA
jgi:hypothetical protein